MGDKESVPQKKERKTRSILKHIMLEFIREELFVVILEYLPLLFEQINLGSFVQNLIYALRSVRWNSKSKERR